LAVDVAGLIVAVVVVAASVHDNAVGIALLSTVALAGTVRTTLVDRMLQGQRGRARASPGIELNGRKR
jgi:predicted transporter